MYSRIKKWAHYRQSIKSTPDNKFPKPATVKKTGATESFVFASSGSGDNIEGKRRRNGPYEIYARRKNTILVLKFVLLAFAILFMVLLYFGFVRG